jgi:hypothetical protein
LFGVVFQLRYVHISFPKPKGTLRKVAYHVQAAERDTS